VARSKPLEALNRKPASMVSVSGLAGLKPLKTVKGKKGKKGKKLGRSKLKKAKHSNNPLERKRTNLALNMHKNDKSPVRGKVKGASKFSRG